MPLTQKQALELLRCIVKPFVEDELAVRKQSYLEPGGKWPQDKEQARFLSEAMVAEDALTLVLEALK